MWLKLHSLFIFHLDFLHWPQDTSAFHFAVVQFHTIRLLFAAAVQELSMNCLEKIECILN